MASVVRLCKLLALPLSAQGIFIKMYGPSTVKTVIKTAKFISKLPETVKTVSDTANKTFAEVDKLKKTMVNQPATKAASNSQIKVMPLKDGEPNMG